MIINNIELILIVVINLLLFFISAVAKSECDTIMFDPKKAWFQTIYWLSKKDTSKRSWLFKYPLSFLWDGWHLLESIKIVCLYAIVGIGLQLSIEYVLLTILIGYVVNGCIFEYFFQN